MVNVNCSSEQDRDTTTSETRPYIPPPKTKNCYLTEGDNKFDRDKCGTGSEGACKGHGENGACKHDDYGGYCKYQSHYWVSIGSDFKKLSDSELLDRYNTSSGSSGEDIRVRRSLKDQERLMTNKIRELQVMGRDPVRSRNINSEDKDDSEIHDFVTDMLFKIGMGASIFVFIVSLSFFLVQRKIM